MAWRGDVESDDQSPGGAQHRARRAFYCRFAAVCSRLLQTTGFAYSQPHRSGIEQKQWHHPMIAELFVRTL